VKTYRAATPIDNKSKCAYPKIPQSISSFDTYTQIVLKNFYSFYSVYVNQIIYFSTIIQKNILTRVKNFRNEF